MPVNITEDYMAIGRSDIRQQTHQWIMKNLHIAVQGDHKKVIDLADTRYFEICTTISDKVRDVVDEVLRKEFPDAPDYMVIGRRADSESRKKS